MSPQNSAVEPLIITVAARKGGVGKTTLSLQLAHYFATHKTTTCLIDLDPQGTATSVLQPKIDGSHLARILTLREKPSPIPTTSWGNLSYLPSGPEIQDSKPEAFRRTLKSIPVDVIIIDCPPGTPDLDSAAVDAADAVIIPSSASPNDLKTTYRLVPVCVEASKSKRATKWAFVLTKINLTKSNDREAPDEIKKNITGLGGAFFTTSQDGMLARALDNNQPPPKTSKSTPQIQSIVQWVKRLKK